MNASRPISRAPNRIAEFPIPALVVTLVVVLCATAFAQPYPGRLGVEASRDAFVDLVRQSYRWEKPDGKSGWAELAREDVDDRGWPTTDCRWIIDFRPVAEWTGHIDDPDAYRTDRSGRYSGSFRGRAALAVLGGTFQLSNTAYNEKENTTTFDLVIPKPAPGIGLVVLGFQDTRREPGSPTGSGIAEFKLIRPGYPADTTQVFTRDYLACFKRASFSTIRFMDVLETNNNVEWGPDHTRLQHWEDRKRLDDASFEKIPPLNKKIGWPWEIAIQLCNETGADLWINLPVSIDDAYIRQLALLVKNELDPKHAVYIEHANEVWNFGFLQYAWNKKRAGEEVKEGKARYNHDNVNDPEIWGQRRHAQRLRDAVAIFGEVFGRDEINGRVRGVLAGVTSNPEGFFICGRLVGMLDYLEATGAMPAEDVYAISIPLYYGGKEATGDKGTETATVDEIVAGMAQSIEARKTDRVAAIALAKARGLKGGVCGYEGGPDTGGGRTENIANRIRAVRDPRQKELYKRNFAEGFWDLGGNLAMQFTLSTRFSRYGTFALTDDVAHPDRGPLFAAARELVGPVTTPTAEPADK